jgi:ABC-type transport system involved in multi-copper enzyme maturation permease subunit
MNWRRIGSLCWFDLSVSLPRLKGLLFLVPFAAFWYPVLHLLHGNLAGWLEQQESLLFAYALFDAALINSLLIERPATLSIYYLLCLTALPFFAMLAACDQFASDRGNGFFRLLGQRCLRSELFVARFLSALLLMGLALAVSGSAAAIIAALRDSHSPGEVLTYLLRINVMLTVYSAALVAFMSIVSAICRSAIGALLLGASAYLAILFFIWINRDLFPETQPLRFLLPSGLKPDLVPVDGGAATAAAAFLLLYAFVYGWIAWLLFRRGDFR